MHLMITKGGIVMSTELAVNNKVLSRYIHNSNTPFDAIAKRIKSINLILDGKKNPTFNQLSTISKMINVPVGLLILDDYIEPYEEKLDFRTINSSDIEEMSSELKDTIKEMRVKQDFLKDEVENHLDFINKFSINDNYQHVAEEIRKYLNININYFENIDDNPFTYFRNRISQIGVFIFLNGKYKDNTHRNLNINEFRGFVLADQKAPIIFINQKDSKKGQLFTLIHELVHLFIGYDEIYNIKEINHNKFDKVEAFVNKVTAEILVPSKIFENIGSKPVDELLKIFPVSEYVLIRRQYDFNFITHNEYKEQVKVLEEKYKEIKNIDRNKGGNYKNNLNFRMDKNFFNYVENAVKSDKISYTDAFKILGVGYKGYKILEN